MIIKTYSTKRYFLSDEDINTLHKAAELLDNLYNKSEEHGEYESNFQEANDSIHYLINELKQNDMGTFWEENYTSINQS